jgi:WXG100 family type VII secretion target
MSFDLRVNHAQLDAAVQDIAATVKAIDGRLDQLEAELAPLKSDWVGSAQQAYAVAKSKWDGAIADLNQVLAEAGVAVSQANTEYAAADRRGASNFQF